MDEGVRLPEEHGGVGRDGNRDLLPVKIEPYRADYINKFCGALFDYWYTVNGEDLSDWTHIEIDGKQLPICKAELKVYDFLSRRTQILLAIDTNDEIVGFLLYYLVYNHVLIVDGMWLEKEYRGSTLVGKMLKKAGPSIQKIIFQTSKKREPQETLRATKDKNRFLLGENESFKTWIMDWRTK